MARILFVSGIHPATRISDLAYKFERFGQLIRCDLAAHCNPHNPYARVEFRNKHDAEDAYNDMHGRYFEESRLSIQWTPPLQLSHRSGRDRECSRSSRRWHERDDSYDRRTPPPPPPQLSHRSSRDRECSRSPCRWYERDDRHGRRTPPPPPQPFHRSGHDRERSRSPRRQYERANGVEKLLPSHPFHRLWMLRMQSDTSSFITQHISEDVEPPSSYWLMTLLDEIMEILDLDNLSGILIREEYTEALMDVIEFAKTGATDFRTKTTGDKDEEVNQDGMNGCFENPFSKLSAEHESRMGGFILFGHPGIGKSIWLLVMLVLRIHAGLPTIYQRVRDHLHVFNEDCVYKLICRDDEPDPDDLRCYAPSTTWVLIDSNQSLITVPLAYRNNFFIVQASSPRPHCFAWQDKSNRLTFRYIMKPWTLSELRLGRKLQDCNCSDEQLIKFYNHFGPSARLLYANASSLTVYELKLREKIGQLTYETLDHMLRQAIGANLLQDISHQILLISPSELRYQFDVSIPTRYLYEILRDTL